MLSQYVPKSLQEEHMITFQHLIYDFNDLLEKLCKEYTIHYIDQMNLDKRYNTGMTNFHLPKEGMEMAAMNILNCLYETIFRVDYYPINTLDSKLKITNGGPVGVYENLLSDYADTISEYCTIDPTTKMELYEKDRVGNIANEHLLEAGVMQKVIAKTKKY